MCGSVLAVLILLSVWDEDVLNVEHVLTIMTALGAAVAGARVFIPGGFRTRVLYQNYACRVLRTPCPVNHFSF